MQDVRTPLDGDTASDPADPRVLDACARRYHAVASLFRPPDGPCAAAIGVLAEPCLSPRGRCSLRGGRVAEASQQALASLGDARDARFLSRNTLGGVEELCLPGFMRVHRSYIVRLGGVTGVRRASKSSFRLVLGDTDKTEIPVSRRLVADVRERLGLE